VLSWSDFEAAAPDLAAAGRRLFMRSDGGDGLLATVRANEPPRIHPISFEIVDGRLYAFILRSAKRTDLEQDGRYALHAHQDPAAPSEFLVRGRATLVTDPVVRARVGAVWPFEVEASYGLFEFSVESALLGSRASADDWPPVYTSWRPTPTDAPDGDRERS
jgi:hypothetical protein